jgi:predicted RNA methylase
VPVDGSGRLGAADAVVVPGADPRGGATIAYLGGAGRAPEAYAAVGAGDGRLTWTLARRAAFVHGIDTDRERIDTARAETPVDLADRVRFSVLSALELDEPPASYEAAVLAWSL